MLLPSLHPLAAAPDYIGLVGIDGIGAGSAAHHVLDRGNVPGLDDVVATPPVEAVRGGVPAVAYEVVRSPAAVEEVSSQAVGDLVRSAEAADLFSVPRAGNPLCGIGADDEGQGLPEFAGVRTLANFALCAVCDVRLPHARRPLPARRTPS